MRLLSRFRAWLYGNNWAMAATKVRLPLFRAEKRRRKSVGAGRPESASRLILTNDVRR